MTDSSFESTNLSSGFRMQRLLPPRTNRRLWKSSVT